MSNEKKFNKIAHRITTIKEMVKDKCVDSIIDYELEDETTNVTISSIHSSDDIRNLLPQGLKIRPFYIDNVNGFL